MTSRSSVAAVFAGATAILVCALITGGACMPGEKVAVEEFRDAWQYAVGCPAYLNASAALLDFFSGDPSTWPDNASLQRVDAVPCGTLKTRHVSVRVMNTGRGGWFYPDTKDAFHFCKRCGMTCQFVWSDVEMNEPHARVYVDDLPSDLDPSSKASDDQKKKEDKKKGDQKKPLTVFLSVDPKVLDVYADPSQDNSDGKLQKKSDKGDEIKRKFDVLVGYHKDSDVQLTQVEKYGGKTRWMSPVKSKDISIFVDGPKWSQKWQFNLAEKLLRSVPYHAFGDNMNNVGGKEEIWQMHKDCKRNFNEFPREGLAPCASSNYKFHLVMEDQRREGYVTDKFFSALDAGTVPIYMGAPDIANFAPPHSFIDASYFLTPDDLAKFVRNVDSDPVRYMNYTAWRRCGVYGSFALAVNNGMRNLPCRLCEKISSML